MSVECPMLPAPGRGGRVKSLEGKTAVVTGAGRGLGRQTAVSLGREGARVVAVARSHDQAQSTAQTILDTGGKAWSVPADVSKPAEVDRLRAEVLRQAGPVSILVNAAGIFGPIQFIKDSDPTRWMDTVATNLFGPYLTCRAFVEDMIAQGFGRIVNFTSAASLHPPGPLNSAYATSKVALNHFTRHLAAELAGTGVTVNVIHPGDVKTEMWAAIRDEAERLGPEAEGYRSWVRWVDATGGDDPQKVADLVLHLMSEEAVVSGRFLWIEDPLQLPIPSWGEGEERQPWLRK